MDVEKLTDTMIAELICHFTSRENRNKILDRLAEILEDEGWYVAESESDLRDLALECTDLVEEDE